MEELNLKFSFETQSSLETFLEALYLVFVCTYNKKDLKVIKFWNIYDASCYIHVKAQDVVA